jgi:hypothetical protein
VKLTSIWQIHLWNSLPTKTQRFPGSESWPLAGTILEFQLRDLRPTHPDRWPRVLPHKMVAQVGDFGWWSWWSTLVTEAWNDATMGIVSIWTYFRLVNYCLLQFIQIQDNFMMILESSWQNMENKSWLKGQVSYQFHWDGRRIVLVIIYDKLVAKI